MRFTARALLLATVAAPLAGCGLDYYLNLAAGGLASIARTRPIDLVLLDPFVDGETKAKLRLVQEVRQFGIDVIGQNAGASFTLYDDDRLFADNGAVGYTLSASARDSFTPFVWHFPFLGPTEYKGFFSRTDAQRERDALREAGYDTFLGVIAGYSTLGLLPDPIRATQLDSDEPDLVMLVLHELTHTTVFKSGDTPFNETLAQFVGRNAARRFYIERRDPGDPATIAALNRYDDQDVIDGYVGQIYDALADWYAQPLSSEEKIAGRQARFEEATAGFESDIQPLLHEPDRYSNIATLQLNNALLLAAVRYRGDLDIYRRVLDRLEGDYRAAWDIFREAAGQPDSFAYLEAWLAGTP